jgi:hypothetical protein
MDGAVPQFAETLLPIFTSVSSPRCFSDTAEAIRFPAPSDGAGSLVITIASSTAA